MRTRVAVLGAGGIGASTHLPAVTGLAADAELVAVAEPDPARLAEAGERFSLRPDRLFTDPFALLATAEPEIVMIATPPHTHEDLVVATLRAGAWAYCEKPLTGSLASADRILAAEAETGQWCVTVSQFRYAAGSQAAYRNLRNGEWGRPLLGTALTEWYRGPEYWDVPWRGKVATEFAGAATTQAYHATDLLLWLMGQWQTVTGFSDTLSRPIDVEDASVAAVRFTSGALAALVATVLSHRQSTRLTVHAERVTVGLDTVYSPKFDEWSITSQVNDPAGADPGWAPREADVLAHSTQLARMMADRRAGRTPELTTAESRGMLEFLSALYKASATGQPVSRATSCPATGSTNLSPARVPPNAPPQTSPEATPPAPYHQSFRR